MAATNYLAIGGRGGDYLLSKQVEEGREGFIEFTIYRQRWRWESGNLPQGLDGPGASGKGLTSVRVKFEEGFVEYEWRYETVVIQVDSGSSGAVGGEESTNIFDGAVTKAPITMHKKIGDWLSYKNPDTGAKYGRVVGDEVIWELEDPTEGSREGAGLGSGAAQEVKSINPFWGVTDFWDISGLWIVEEAMTRAELYDVLGGVGKISSPPGAAGAGVGAASDRNYIYGGASAVQRGNKFLVRRTWILSGEGGWEPAIYDPQYWG